MSHVNLTRSGWIVALLLMLGIAAPAWAATPDYTISARRDGIDASQGTMTMQVTALNDTMLRVRIGRAGHLPEDASWAVPAAVRSHSIAVRALPNGFSTGAMKVVVEPDLKLTVTDLAGRVIVADDAVPLRFDGQAFTLRKALGRSEHIFALGDKTGDSLDRRGQSFVDWNTDAYAFTSSTDPIYKSIPFFVAVGGAGGSYGLLLDNSWRAWFDFGHRDADVINFGAPDGPIDYYVIAGPTTAEVVRRYSDLTGKAPLAPQWALGYQQSRYSYMTAGEARDVVARLKKDALPTDVLWLDIDFQDRNRPFTVDKAAFPDLKGLAGDLRQQGVKLITITDLHIAEAPGQGYSPYDSGIAGNHFVHNPNGSNFVGKVWPGASLFPDFTDAGARRWWGTLYAPFVADGVAGFWNDMNEPSVFETPTATMPLDAVHKVSGDDFTPRRALHAEVHNVYGMEQTRATYEGLRTLSPDERAFVMTRASYAGGQRYAVTWTGDNSATWNHLKLSVHQLINLGLSGFSYSGSDVGGFTGGPSPDLMTRWFEIAAFTPIFRDHSAKGTPRAEPWIDGPEHLAIRRRFVEQRYRLMPYLYTLADQNARTGDPIMRPVFYDYPALLTAPCDQAMSFTLGRSLLIAPPPKMESPQSYDVCLPAGGWFDFWTGKPVTPAGGQGSPVETITELPALDRLPVFVRAGSIIPSQPLVQSTAQTPQGALTLDVYPGADCSGSLYLDDGHSMGFARGHYLRQLFRCEQLKSGELKIEFLRREGDYAPWWKRIALAVHDFPKGGTIELHGRSVAGEASDGSLHFDLPDENGATIMVRRPGDICAIFKPGGQAALLLRLAGQ